MAPAPFRHSAFVIATLVGALFAVLAGCQKKAPAPPSSVPGTITTPTGVEMVRVAAGEFTMGGRGDDDEQPAHRVKIDAFCMDRTEVTQKSYESLMGGNPSKFKGPDRPVESLSWLAAAKYCNARSLKEGRKPCYDLKTLACDFAADGYRLPTEAEWEYACRAGSEADFSFGESPGPLAEYAWCKANADKATHPAAQKKPNAWGLCDMHGNVAEWCQDFYSPKAYASAGGDNPRGPTSSDTRVLRGGSWRDAADRCRSAARASEAPGLADACFGYECYGFRCVRADR